MSYELLTKAEILKLAKEGRQIYNEDEKLIAGTVLISELDEVLTLEEFPISIKKVHSGSKVIVDGNSYSVLSKRTLGQSSGLASTADGWDELFMRPTCANLFADINEGGHLVWNVADVRVHKTLEANTCRITEEEGFEHIDTIKYGLQRVPGAILQTAEDGTQSRVNLRDLKNAWEPVFIFKKPIKD